MSLVFENLRRFHVLLAAVLLALAVALAYGVILQFPMTDIDTWPLLLTTRVHHLNDLQGLLTHELLDGRMINARYYRPLLSLTYAADQWLWGLQPAAFHATDLFIHWGCALLVFAIARRLLGKDQLWAPFLAALLFAVHPVHVENVPAIARRADLLVALFYAASLWCVLAGKRRPALALGFALLFYLAALLSKESAVTLPLVALAAAFFVCKQSRRALLQTFGGFAATSIGYLILRAAILGTAGGYTQTLNVKVRALSNLAGQPLGLFFAGHAGSWGLVTRPDFLPALGRGLLTVAFGTLILVLPWSSWKNKYRSSAAPAAWRTALKFCGIWMAAHAALLVVFGFNFRYLYLEIMPFAIIAAMGLARLPQLCAAVFSGTFRKRAARLALVAALVWLLTDYGTGLISRRGLEHWREDALLADTLAQQVAQLVQAQPPQTTFFLVNFPYQAIEIPTVNFLTQPLSIITLEHSIQAYVDLFAPDKKARIVGLSYVYQYLQPDSEHYARQPLEVDAAFENAKRLSVHVNAGGHPTGLPWDEAFGPRYRDRVYTTTKQSRDTVVVDLLPAAEAMTPSLFVIYDGSPTLQVLERPAS